MNLSQIIQVGRTAKVELLTDKACLFRSLTAKIRKVLKGNLDKDEKLKAICRLLKDNVSYCDWVGFYLVNPKKQGELLLGAYVGEPTEHVRIPFGKGICGQAAETRKTLIVQDVSKETNYLSCNPHVKSEIVVPIFKDETIVGELDIDSHTLSPFTKEDVDFLRNTSEIVATIL
jgi:L-methionine (R)-S-oxide reductase